MTSYVRKSTLLAAGLMLVIGLALGLVTVVDYYARPRPRTP